jgi:LPS sulfotransferase NodH
MCTYLDDALGFLRRATRLANLDDAALLRRIFPRPHFVSVCRRDVVAQAVSWAKSEQTSEWYAGDPRRRSDPPRFDFEQVHKLVATAEHFQVFGRQWFAQHEIEPFEITYEDLVHDMDGITRAILDFLKLPLPDHRIEPTLRPQNGAVNAEWIREYRSRASPLT